MYITKHSMLCTDKHTDYGDKVNKNSISDFQAFKHKCKLPHIKFGINKPYLQVSFEHGQF